MFDQSKLVVGRALWTRRVLTSIVNKGKAMGLVLLIVASLACGVTRVPSLPPTVLPIVTKAHPTPTGLPDSFFSLESYNYPGHYIRHRNFLGELTKISSNLDRQDSTFKFIPGLADGDCITFESLNYPGYYLRHQDYRIKLHRWEDSQLFREDVTFCEQPGLAASDWVSFESYNYPGYFIRHRDYHLYIERGNSELFRADVTFRIVPNPFEEGSSPTSTPGPLFPGWRTNLNCEPAEQKYSGVEYCTGLAGDAHVLVIDLYEPGIRLEYVIAKGLDRNDDPKEDEPHECQDVNIPKWSSGPGCYAPENELFYPVMSLLDAVNRNSSAAAIINTDYGAGTQGEPKSREHGPEGFTVVQGNRIDGPIVGDTDNNAENRPWLAVGKGSPLQAAFGQFPRGEDNGNKPDWVYTGVGGAPWLIKNGQIDDDQVNNCRNAEQHSCDSTFAQTAVALSQDGRWLYLVVVVRRDARGTAQFLYDALKPCDAIKMDGGGSSQLWYGGRPGNSLEDRIVFPGDGRKLSQYLAVFAKPGSGITIESGP